MFAKMVYKLKFLALKIARTFHLISKKDFKIRRSIYKEIIDFNLTTNGNKITQFIEEVQKNADKNQKKLLFITPDCSFTGAPLVLFKVAQIMKKKGYLVAFISLEDGPLSSNLQQEDFSFMQLNSISCTPDKLLQKLTSEFNLCLCNTILTHKEAVTMQKYLPTLFYIHEAKNLHDFEAYDPMMTISLPQIKNIICPSQYSAEFIKNLQILGLQFVPMLLMTYSLQTCLKLQIKLSNLPLLEQCLNAKPLILSALLLQA